MGLLSLETPASEEQVETQQPAKSEETATTEEAMAEPAADVSAETTENEDAHALAAKDSETYVVVRVREKLTQVEQYHQELVVFPKSDVRDALKQERSEWSRASRRMQYSGGQGCDRVQHSVALTWTKCVAVPPRETQSAHSAPSDSKLATALEEYKTAAARSEAMKESLEDQVQKAAAAETSQVESEAVKDSANDEQALKAQENAEADEAEVSAKAAAAREVTSDAERDLDDVRSSEASQQTDEQPISKHTDSSQTDTVRAQSTPGQNTSTLASPERVYPVWRKTSSTTLRKLWTSKGERERLMNGVGARIRECSAGGGRDGQSHEGQRSEWPKESETHERSQNTSPKHDRREGIAEVRSQDEQR